MRYESLARLFASSLPSCRRGRRSSNRCRRGDNARSCGRRGGHATATLDGDGAADLRKPPLPELERIAKSYNLALSRDDLTSFRNLMDGVLASHRAWRTCPSVTVLDV